MYSAVNTEIKMEMKSLYDYLGYAAGGKLGQEVAYAAAKAGVQHSTRYVKNSRYEGEVYLYPESFLKEYFEMKQNG